MYSPYLSALRVIGFRLGDGGCRIIGHGDVLRMYWSPSTHGYFTEPA
jgi:hypothetical protein